MPARTLLGDVSGLPWALSFPGHRRKMGVMDLQASEGKRLR